MSEYAMIHLCVKYIDIFTDQIGRNRRFALALYFQTYLVFQVFALLLDQMISNTFHSFLFLPNVSLDLRSNVSHIGIHESDQCVAVLI